ncbi:alpha/beta hydrolase [Actinoplanes sp. NPDC051494]|uniref:alpha/beta hydrolase n=1 Tax=Actinoplanes sp. NPDC051494 TaxID=3363907 RepID=UPI0037A3A5E2
MRRILATAAMLGLVLSGAAVASAAPSAAAPAIVWGACKNNPALTGRKAECGYLSVPLDHAKPNGKRIQLAVSRIRHTVPAAKYQGVMLVNPGGPGAPGLSLPTLGGFVPGGGGGAYDWIGFDPRGVGSSRPALTCDSDYFAPGRPADVPTTTAIENAWRKKARNYAADCAAAGGDLLEHLRTTDTVRDMDLLRIALGTQKINFYGFSYGTYLAQVYATLFPQRVRRMVLDGSVDPSRVWYDSNLDQDIAFERSMNVFFAWVAKYDRLYHLGTSATAVEKLFYQRKAQLTKKPIRGFGASELTDVFLQAGYYVFGWEAIAGAFSAWVGDGDLADLRDLYAASNPTDKGADNGYAMYVATMCTDARWPTSWKTWRRDNRRVYAKAPFETWGNAWFNAPCLTWPARPGTPVTVDGRDTPPILLISETLDAATPYPGSLEVRRRFPRAVLVEGVGGSTHAGSLFGGATCIDNTVAEYLATGELPTRVKATTSDKRCAPVAQPDPTTSEARRADDPLRLELRKLLAPR